MQFPEALTSKAVRRPRWPQLHSLSRSLGASFLQGSGRPQFCKPCGEGHFARTQLLVCRQILELQGSATQEAEGVARANANSAQQAMGWLVKAKGGYRRTAQALQQAQVAAAADSVEELRQAARCNLALLGLAQLRTHACRAVRDMQQAGAGAGERGKRLTLQRRRPRLQAFPVVLEWSWS